MLGAATYGNFAILDWNGAATLGVGTNAFVLGTVPAASVCSLQIVSNTLRWSLRPPARRASPPTPSHRLRLAINDLALRYAAEYGPLAPGYLARLAAIESSYLAAVSGGNQAGIAAADCAYQVLKREALVLNNPALAFNRVLFVRRSTRRRPAAELAESFPPSATPPATTRIGLLDITNNAVSDFYVPASGNFVGYLEPALERRPPAVHRRSASPTASAPTPCSR